MQAYTHTDMLMAILHTAIGGKVTNVVPPVPGWTRWHPRLLPRHCPGRQSQIWWPEIYHRVPGTVSYRNQQSADAASDQPTKTTHLAKYQRDGRQWCSNWLTDWVVVLRPTWHKIGHFGDVNLLAWRGKTKPNTTKAHIHQSKEMYYNTK